MVHSWSPRRHRQPPLHRWRPPDLLGAGDIVTIAEQVRWGDTTDWTPRVGAYRTHRHDYDEDFEEILDIAKSSIPANDIDFAPSVLEAFLDNALHLMRIGFNKAKRRFGPHPFHAYDTFNRIRDAVIFHARHLEFAGQEFILSYGNGKAFCHEHYLD